MNGVHDMGGMHGFGPVRPEPNEPVFHEDWEGRVRALVQLTGFLRKWNGDYGRYTIEQLPPEDYLRLSYFEKWLDALVYRLLVAGLVTPEELAEGRKAAEAPVATPPVTAESAVKSAVTVPTYERDVAAKPRFASGDRVRARNINPEGHTRLPRYARGHSGIVERHHGAHVFPDSNARFAGEAPQALYTVGFTAEELWGKTAKPGDMVYLDLWEDYLEPA